MKDDKRFERAIETLLADRSPRSVVAGLSDENLRLVRVAELVRGSRGQDMAPEYVERLYARLFPEKRRLTRRVALLSGLSTLAAGVLAGTGLQRAVEQSGSVNSSSLVGANGKWYPVASLADLPEGSIRPFTAGAVQGFLIRSNGEVRALSRICTHMGCLLQVDQQERTLECPCHGAGFDLAGRLRYGPRAYGRPLPPLPSIATRVQAETVEVLGL